MLLDLSVMEPSKVGQTVGHTGNFVGACVRAPKLVGPRFAMQRAVSNFI